MYLIVGLGNPGSRYAKNRHNIGFQILALWADRHNLRFDRLQKEAQVAQGVVGDKKVLLAQPQTYMNESGRAVQGLLHFYKIPLEQLIVVYDDLDLPLGQLRLRPQGGAGGQRGVRSIIQSVGSEAFARLRVGIGRPPGRMEPAAYVLQDFSDEQEAEMAITRQLAGDALSCWLAEGLPATMNRFNG